MRVTTVADSAGALASGWGNLGSAWDVLTGDAILLSI